MMVWTGSDMAASYGNWMPDSYYEYAVVEADRFAASVLLDAENWSAISGTEVSCVVRDYVGPDDYMLEVTVAGLGVTCFDSMAAAMKWFDIVWPASKVGTP